MVGCSLTTAIVSPDPAVRRQLQEALESGSLTEAVWSMSVYPDIPALERLKEASSGCVLFLDCSDPVCAQRVAMELDRAYPFVCVVGVLSGGTKNDVIALMRAGIREFLSDPITSSEVAAALGRASKTLNPLSAAAGSIHAFLPARAGAGATTVAISTAAAVARLSQRPTLLLDFDLRFGITSFLLKLDGRYSVQNALNASTHVDEDFLETLVTRRDNLDILGSGPDELPSEPRRDQCAALLDCAQSRYGAIFVDLPGAMEAHELETLHRAKEIFLVLTSDMAGLHMGKRRAEALRRLQLTDRVSVLISQAEGRRSLALADIEKLLQLPVRFILPKDEQAVNEAVLQGAAVRADSKVGAQIEAIAKTIARAPAATPLPARRTHHFLEFFAVSPDRDRYRWKE
jgi:pilus assembly protein CpaE